MDESAELAVEPLRSGKGVRIPLSSTAINFLREATTAIEVAWDSAETPKAAFELLKTQWGTFDTDGYGDRTWTGMPHKSEDEFRITVVLNKGRLAVDFREWFMPH